MKLFYDTETTGLPQWKEPSGADVQPRIVQLAAVLVDEDTRQVTQALDLIIKPNGWFIPEETVAGHGITTEYALEYGVDEKLAVELFLNLRANHGCVAHNKSFDKRIIRIATKRYFSEEVQKHWHLNEDHECTMLMSKPILELPGQRGWKPPKLEEAYEFFTGKKLEKAHSAMADTMAAVEVYFGILDYKAKQVG